MDNIGIKLKLGDFFDLKIVHKLLLMCAKDFTSALKDFLDYLLMYQLISYETNKKIRKYLFLDKEWKQLSKYSNNLFGLYTGKLEEDFFNPEDVIVWIISQLYKDCLFEKKIKLGGYNSFVQELNRYEIDINMIVSKEDVIKMKNPIFADGYVFYFEKNINGLECLCMVPYDKKWKEPIKVEYKSNVKEGVLPWMQYCEKTNMIYCKIASGKGYIKYSIDKKRISMVQKDLIRVTSDGKEWFYNENKDVCLETDYLDMNIKNTSERELVICDDGSGVIAVPNGKGLNVRKPYKMSVIPSNGICSDDFAEKVIWRLFIPTLYKEGKSIEINSITNMLIYDEVMKAPSPFDVCNVKEKLSQLREMSSYFDGDKIDELLKCVSLMDVKKKTIVDELYSSFNINSMKKMFVH